MSRRAPGQLAPSRFPFVSFFFLPVSIRPDFASSFLLENCCCFFTFSFPLRENVHGQRNKRTEFSKFAITLSKKERKRKEKKRKKEKNPSQPRGYLCYVVNVSRNYRMDITIGSCTCVSVHVCARVRRSIFQPSISQRSSIVTRTSTMHPILSIPRFSPLKQKKKKKKKEDERKKKRGTR